MNTAGHSSERLRRTHTLDGAADLAISGREADLDLHLDGASRGMVDTTHFDVGRFPPPDWPARLRRGGEGRLGRIHRIPGRRRTSAALRRGDLRPDGDQRGPGSQPRPGDGDAGCAVRDAERAGDVGDRVALTDPEYLFAERILRFLGAEVVRIPLTRRDGGMDPDLDRLADAASEASRGGEGSGCS